MPKYLDIDEFAERFLDVLSDFEGRDLRTAHRKKEIAKLVRKAYADSPEPDITKLVDELIKAIFGA